MTVIFPTPGDQYRLGSRAVALSPDEAAAMQIDERPLTIARRDTVFGSDDFRAHATMIFGSIVTG